VIFKEWFVENAKPEWKKGKLSDICTFQSKRTDSSGLTVKNYISTENIVPNKQGFQPAATLPTVNQVPLVEEGNILISNIRPYFKKIVFSDFTGGCSTDVLNFVSFEDKYTLYLYRILYDDMFFDYVMAGSKGTKMPRGDKQQIMDYDICIPDNETLERFNRLLKPVVIQINDNTSENKRLTELRDTLLPKLMNGEIEV
jgi:type I restriction enzyme, S subunit